MNPETKLFIDGELVDAVSGKTYPNFSPVTEAVIGETADAGEEDMERAIAAARVATCAAARVASPGPADELGVHLQPDGSRPAPARWRFQ